MTNLGAIRVAFRYKGIERQKTFITVQNSGGDVLLVTSVKRSVNDKHDKSLARFYAFRKAMHQLMLHQLATKEQRKEAWRLFRESINIPASVNLTLPKRVAKARA